MCDVQGMRVLAFECLAAALIVDWHSPVSVMKDAIRGVSAVFTSGIRGAQEEAVAAIADNSASEKFIHAVVKDVLFFDGQWGGCNVLGFLLEVFNILVLSNVGNVSDNVDLGGKDSHPFIMACPGCPVTAGEKCLDHGHMCFGADFEVIHLRGHARGCCGQCKGHRCQFFVDRCSSCMARVALHDAVDTVGVELGLFEKLEDSTVSRDWRRIVTCVGGLKFLIFGCLRFIVGWVWCINVWFGRSVHGG